MPQQLRYDKRRVVVEASRPVEIVLENRDVMPHNLVITAPGAREEVGRAAQVMTPEPDEQGRHYVPRSDKVLHATRMLKPGEKQRLSFNAPDVPGDYPYVCTFPGHWMRMYGTLVVVADLEAYLKNPPPLTAEPELTEWKLDDLAPHLASITADRADAGREVFMTTVGCAQCHRVGTQGANFGPDLTDVFTRWKGNRADVLREILDPSRTIEEKYRNTVFALDDGSIAAGMIVSEDADSVTIQSGPTEGFTLRFEKEEIVERRQQPLSVMPIGLLSPLTKEQILDLLAFLQYGLPRSATDASPAATDD